MSDPAWGARVTRRADRFDGTALVTRDDGGGLVLLPGPYGTGFASQDKESVASFLRGRWQVGGATAGLLATDRRYEDSSYNRVLGPDFVWFPDTEQRVRAQVLGSWTTALADGTGSLSKGERVSGHAALLDWNHRGQAWDFYLNAEDVAEGFRGDNGFIDQNGYRKVRSETARKFRDVGPFNEVAPYLNAEYKTDRHGEVVYQSHFLGLRLGLPRATTIWMEARPNNIVVARQDGGKKKRDQVFFGIESNPSSWFAKFYSEVAYGDRLDVANNRIGKGAFCTIQANLRPHARAEVEYRIDNDYIDSLEDVEGSKRIYTQRVQQLLAIWHFTARDSLRTIWQSSWVRRAPSLWEQPVSSREKSDTLSLVYSHRRGIGFTFYVGVNYGRSEDADAGTRRYQAEVFTKGSWTFDVL